MALVALQGLPPVLNTQAKVGEYAEYGFPNIDPDDFIDDDSNAITYNPAHPQTLEEAEEARKTYLFLLAGETWVNPEDETDTFTANEYLTYFITDRPDEVEALIYAELRTPFAAGKPHSSVTGEFVLSCPHNPSIYSTGTLKNCGESIVGENISKVYKADESKYDEKSRYCLASLVYWLFCPGVVPESCGDVWVHVPSEGKWRRYATEDPYTGGIMYFDADGNVLKDKGSCYVRDQLQLAEEKFAKTIGTCTDLIQNLQLKIAELEAKLYAREPNQTEPDLLWLEQDVKIAGQSVKCILQDENNVLPEGTQLGVNYIEPGSARYNELRSQLDATHDIENVRFFELTLRHADGSKVDMPLKGNVRVLLQIPSGWDKADLEAVLVQAGADIEFDEALETIDGVEYLSFWTDHFSPYAMIDKLTEAEKQELEKATTKAIKTGEAVGLYAGPDAMLLAAAGALVLILTKKRKLTATR